MQIKDVLPVVTLVNAVTTGGSITSDALPIANYDNIGIQIAWTSTSAGTFSVELSLDGVQWDAITLSPVPTAAGSAATAYVSLNQIDANYLRVKYTRTSGSGTATVLVGAKAL